MGEVISISRVSDLDILSEFDVQCPAIPADIERSIQQTAEKAVGKVQPNAGAGSFRVTSVAVVVFSLMALAGVKLIANHMAADSTYSNYNYGSGTVTKDWRASRESWAAYLTHLKNDPLVRHLHAEEALFKQKFSQTELP